MTSANPRRHHYVPRFLIERFADKKGKVEAYDRTLRKVRKNQNPKRVLFENDFYRASTKQKSDEYTVEHLFSTGESQWAPLVRSVVKNGIIEYDQIPTIAEFLAVQAIRTRQHRHRYQVGTDYLKTGMTIIDLREQQRTGNLPTDDQAKVDQFITEVNAGQVRVSEPDTNLLKMQLSVLSQTFEVLTTGWQYIIVSIDHPGFVLTDEPIARLGDWDGSTLPDVGIANAEELWMPLDPAHALVLTRDLAMPRYITGLHPDHIWKINKLLVLGSMRWTIYRPGTTPLQKMDIPTDPPKWFIDEFTVSGLGKEEGTSILQFGRPRPHVEDEQLLSGRRLIPFPEREHNYLGDRQIWIPDNDPPFENLPTIDARLL